MSADDRAQIIAERDAQIIAWLGKKAAEYGTSNQESRAKAEAVSRMADKLSRGAVRDDETGVSELYRLKAENNQLRAQVAEVCGQRDAWHNWADTLAYKVAPVEVLGRHGEEGKFPWDDALKLITPAAEVAALRARVAELEAAAAQVAKFCAQRAEYVRNARDYHPGGDADYWRWNGHAEARRQLSQTLGLPVAWPAEDKAAPVLQQRQAEDPHTSPLHHDYVLGRDDLPAIPHQTTGRCPRCNGTFEDCTCGGTA